MMEPTEETVIVTTDMQDEPTEEVEPVKSWQRLGLTEYEWCKALDDPDQE